MQNALIQRSALAAPSSRTRAPRLAAQASAKPMWLPNTKSPAHLTGKLAGDRGFDPLVSRQWWLRGMLRCVCPSDLGAEGVARDLRGGQKNTEFRSQFDGRETR